MFKRRISQYEHIIHYRGYSIGFDKPRTFFFIDKAGLEATFSANSLRAAKRIVDDLSVRGVSGVLSGSGVVVDAVPPVKH